MKKLTLILIVALVAGFVFSTGQDETATETVVFVNDEGDPALAPGLVEGKFYSDYIRALFQRDTPYDVELRTYPVVDGSTALLDAAIAGGDVDVMLGFAGRMSKYLNARYALPLDLPKSVLKQYNPSFVNSLKKDGVLYGLPDTAWTRGFAINKMLAAKVGLSLPADDDPDRTWSIDTFVDAAKRVQRLPGDNYGTFLFAGTTSGDYYVAGWLTSFGAELWKNGKIAVNTPEGVEALEFLRMLIVEGLAPAGAAGLNDEDLPVEWSSGRYLASGVATAWCEETPKKAFEAGIAKEQWSAVMMAYPNAPGKTSQYTSGSYAAFVHKNTRRPEAAIAFLQMLTGYAAQSFKVAAGLSSSRFDVDVTPAWAPEALKWRAVEQQIIADQGIMDQGWAVEQNSIIRGMWRDLLQGIFSGSTKNISAAVAEFQDEANALIK